MLASRSGGASSEGVTAGGGIIVPTGPSGAGGFGDQPPKQPQDAPDPKQEIKCNSDEDEDVEDAEEGSPESTSGNGPSAPQIGSYSPSIFKFITIIPDDGTDKSGGWQEAKAALYVKRTYGLTVESFTCPQITIGTPLRNQKQGKISAEMAAEVSAEIATYVSGVVKDVPQGIFCFKLKEGMAAMMPQAISGSSVKQP